MHVLALSRALPFHGIGGMQAIAWDILRTLASFGHRVTVITTAIEGHPDAFESDGVHVVPLPGAAAEKYGRLWWRESDAQALALHRLAPVDAVLSISAAAAGLARFRRAAPRVPFLFQAHGTSWGEFESKWRSGKPLQWLKSVKNLVWLFKDARIYRRFDEIVMVGDVLEEQFRQWPMPWVAGSVPRHLIRNGVDTGLFRPDAAAGAATRRRLGIPQDASVFVFAARLHPQKGGRQLLRAFDIVAAENERAWLLIIGGGEDEGALKHEASALSSGGRIVFTGSIERTQMPAHLASAQVFVFPSMRKEALPMNVLEALACGLPAVISKSMESVFSKALLIKFVDPEQPKELARYMAAVLQPMGALRCLIEETYTLHHCAQAYEVRLAKWAVNQ